MGLELEFTDGQTPLDDDELDGLLIPSITTRGELDEFEQLNIESAVEWTMRRKFKAKEIFSEEFVRNLHRKMYGNVWKWAGEFRRTEKSIGIDPFQISAALMQLNENGLHWINSKVFSEDEIAIRYKHELVKIHCFANGNGRHSRLMADIIIRNVFRMPVYSWGHSNIVKSGDVRKAYLNAIKEADKNSLTKLIEFARS